MTREIMRERPADIEQVYVLSNWAEENQDILKPHLNKTIIISPKELERISNLKTPNKALLLVKKFNYREELSDTSNQWILYLDDIQDPGNLGTIIRNADWFGIKYVFCSPGCAEIYNSKVIQATMGSIFRVVLQVKSLEEVKKQFSKFPVLGFLMDGKNIYERKATEAGIIVIGNEGRGIRQENEQWLDEKLRIPSKANSRAESLNAAVASGIACSILCR